MTIAEQLIKEGELRGKQEGRQEGKQAEARLIAKKMLDAEMNIKVIEAMTGLPEQEISQL